MLQVTESEAVGEGDKTDSEVDFKVAEGGGGVK